MDQKEAKTLESGERGMKLYSQAALDIATALGSIVAGSFLLASNLKKLGRNDEIYKVFLFSFGVVLAIFLAILNLPSLEKIPGFVWQAFQVAIIHWYAEKMIGEDLRKYTQDNGAFYSRWRAAGIALLITPLVLALFIGVSFLGQTKVDFGNNQCVYYELGATKNDAKRLGNYLIDTEYFGGEYPADVTIDLKNGEINISFVLQDGAWLESEVISYFETARTELAEHVFTDEKVNILLCDGSYDAKKTISE
jgi:hypothetical protein